MVRWTISHRLEPPVLIDDLANIINSEIGVLHRLPCKHMATNVLRISARSKHRTPTSFDSPV